MRQELLMAVSRYLAAASRSTPTTGLSRPFLLHREAESADDLRALDDVSRRSLSHVTGKLVRLRKAGELSEKDFQTLMRAVTAKSVERNVVSRVDQAAKKVDKVLWRSLDRAFGKRRP
jgi:hypothetical protein